ncbi:MAG: hypothetical protein AAFY39_06250 [Pseudomonadota bacterium]
MVGPMGIAVHQGGSALISMGGGTSVLLLDVRLGDLDIGDVIF